MFLLRSGESLYSVGNSFILGLFVAPVYVGYFAGADKITRAAFGLVIPIRDVLFPRMSHLASRSLERAQRLARSGMVLMAAGGVTLGVIQWTFAPLIVRVLMGAGFEPAVTVLRIESAFHILLSVTCSLGMQWLVPLGYDRLVSRTTLTAGALNIALATILAPRFAHVGMAWSVITVETFVAVSFLVMAARTCPLWGKRSVGKSCAAAQVGTVTAGSFPAGDSAGIQ
jgi:PST family polysaccharide transporter